MENIELFKSLSSFVKQMHKVLSKGGKEALKDELLSKCRKKGNFFLEMESIQKLLRLWDDLLIQLDKVAVQLEKGDVKSIIKATKDLVNSVTALQIFIATAFVEIGSFVPGPVGIVCSLALAIGCFATGNIAGGFLNLLGAIPFAKCAKFLPKTQFLKMLSTSGLSKFKPKGFEQYMFGLTSKIPKFTFNNKLSQMFDKVIGESQKTDIHLIKGVGSYNMKQPILLEGVGTPKNSLFNYGLNSNRTLLFERNEIYYSQQTKSVPEYLLPLD
mgnify:FL=1